MKRALVLLFTAITACAQAPAEPAPQAQTEHATTLQDGIGSVIKAADTAKYVLESGLVTTLYAKEMCSCLFVSGMPPDECQDQVKIPVDIASLNRAMDAAGVRHVVSSDDLVKVTIDAAAKTVTTEGSVSGEVARALGIRSPINRRTVATFDGEHPRFGCRITAKEGVRL